MCVRSKQPVDCGSNLICMRLPTRTYIHELPAVYILLRLIISINLHVFEWHLYKTRWTTTLRRCRKSYKTVSHTDMNLLSRLLDCCQTFWSGTTKWSRYNKCILWTNTALPEFFGFAVGIYTIVDWRRTNTQNIWSSIIQINLMKCHVLGVRAQIFHCALFNGYTHVGAFLLA